MNEQTNEYEEIVKDIQEDPDKKMQQLFQKVFEEETAKQPEVFFAPGRVNLIGEHTDYNGGHVFPCAISMGTYCAIRKRDDQKIHFFSANFVQAGVQERTIDETQPIGHGWTDYPVGVVYTMRQAGYEIPTGFDMVVYGNLPNSSGLSSSASIEVLTAYALSQLFGITISFVEIAQLCQQSENGFNGVNCGIMDQFAIAMGQDGQAIFLDTATLEYKYVPLHMQGYKIVIACSNKKRGLGDSKYNERRAECEAALQEIKQMQKAGQVRSEQNMGASATENVIHTLGELDEAQFAQYESAITDPVERVRARHAVTENQRTIQAVTALQDNDLQQFGQLLNASHRSLKEDYEVTGVELDTLVESAWKQRGVLGSRMTGAGFGGCTVSIVAEDAVDDFIKNVSAEYQEKIGYAADFYVVQAAGGPVKL